jgi:hypothetical protein
LESGFVLESASVQVLKPPLLGVRNDYTPHEVTLDQPFVISAEITNLGDYPIDNINVTLEPSEGISTTEPLTKNIGNLSGGETKNVNWTAVGNVEGLFTYSIFAMDETGQLTDTNFALITVEKKGCFIATAVYGTPMAEEIEILREFRDEYLLDNQVGQALVGLYYKVSPPIAEFITEHPSLKPIVRAGLLPAVAMSIVIVNTTPAEKTAILGLLVLVSVALAVWARRWRGRGTEYTSG